MTDIPLFHYRSNPRPAAYDDDIRHRDDESFPLFVRLSVALTGFSEAELDATRMAGVYFEELGLVVGVSIRREFLKAGLEPDAMLASPFFGPLARNVIRMWYLGQWKPLLQDWIDLTGAPEKFDEFRRNTDRIVSEEAYKRGLAWAAIGANPPGTRQPGFRSWKEPPPE